MSTKKLSPARLCLKDLRGHDLTFGTLIESIRKSDDISQSSLAKMMGISRAHLCDIEKGRRLISPLRAANFAKLMGYNSEHFISLAIQDQLDQAGLKFKVELKKAA